MDDSLGNGRGMCPAKGQGEEGVGMAWSTDPHATNVRGWETDAPKAVSEIERGNAWSG